MRMGNHEEGAKWQRGGCGAQRGLTIQLWGGGKGWLPRGGGRAKWRTSVVLSGVGCCTLQFEEMEARRLGFLRDLGTW